MLIFGYFALINTAGLFIMWYDKSQAIIRARRVPEKRLFAIAALGGATGVWMGMYLFRHKTKHLLFKLGIPLLIIMNLILLLILSTKVIFN
ncbi:MULTISPECIES: DUF1294 domain-containing protein [Paenibacillus]|uniref:DUF1294 domain-containing protein n=2 Tax=Paenibacillus urinalis TaxID=521520 RepID=A0ABY7XHV8_9BACL|nr:MULTISPECIES: DUF1294 domain-containing protein [Paenibacillus]WDI05345.1 DUF1294 domain-containing protein [Paenibacillus urinalis]